MKRRIDTTFHAAVVDHDTHVLIRDIKPKGIFPKNWLEWRHMKNLLRLQAIRWQDWAEIFVIAHVRVAISIGVIHLSNDHGKYI